MEFSSASKDGMRSVTVFHDGEIYMASNRSHGNFEEIMRKLVDDDVSVIDLFSPAKTVERKLQHLSERVSVKNDRVYFDGVEINSALTQQILRFLDEGVEDWKPLVLFYEKLQSNPSEHSREQLYVWLEKQGFTIESDGNFVAYKGVNYQDGQYWSVHAGQAVVDNEEYTGHIPNKIGSIITMPRDEVMQDSFVGCAAGLHAANWKYAHDFGSVTLQLSVNPRDVVSVPSDCDAQKLRVCRYKVVQEVERPHTTAVLEKDYEEEWPVDDYEDSEDESYVF